MLVLWSPDACDNTQVGLVAFSVLFVYAILSDVKPQKVTEVVGAEPAARKVGTVLYFRINGLLTPLLPSEASEEYHSW